MRAPARPSARAAAAPMPLLAPVTITLRPDMSGRSAVLKVDMVFLSGEVGDSNIVDADNKDVNDNILR
jgi:hypothetical protein